MTKNFKRCIIRCRLQYPISGIPLVSALHFRKGEWMKRFSALLLLAVAVNMATPATSVAHATDPPVVVKVQNYSDVTQQIVSNDPAPTMGTGVVENLDLVTFNSASLGAPTRASPVPVIGYEAEITASVAFAVLDDYTIDPIKSGVLMALSISTSRVMDPEFRWRPHLWFAI